MEKMIRDIVDADREARLRLLEKQKEKDNIQSASASRIVLTPTERGKERREGYGQSQCHRGKGEKPAWRAA